MDPYILVCPTQLVGNGGGTTTSRADKEVSHQESEEHGLINDLGGSAEAVRDMIIYSNV